MDPLSITAAVVGLLAAAGQVATVLSNIKASVSDAPNSIEQTLSHVKELQACFAAVHKFIVGTSPATLASQRRLSMIEVDQLVATLTESVLTFSELELLITPFETLPQASIRKRIKWAWTEDVVSSIVLRLDRHKSSLSLMLNIVQCESDREAEQSQQSLLLLVQQLVENNVEISQRLKALETTLETESILTACFRNGNTVETGDSADAITDQPLEISRRTTTTPMILDSSSTGLPTIGFHSAFESDLNDSRVYKRMQPYECDVSFTSSAVRSHSWSVFSGLSLSQISSISVIALPVYSRELFNKEWYEFVFFDQPDSQKASALAARIEEIPRADREEEVDASVVAVEAGTEGESMLPSIQEVEEIDDESVEDEKDEETSYDSGIYNYGSESESDAPVLTEAANGGLARADFWIPQATPDGRLFYFNTETGESSMELPLEWPSSPTLSNDSSDSDQTVLAEEGDRLILPSRDSQPSRTSLSMIQVSQPIETNMSGIKPVISGSVGKIQPYKLIASTDSGTIYSRNLPLPTQDECYALSDDECRLIQQYQDPYSERIYKEWEPKYQAELVRHYMRMLDFNQIEAAMKPTLVWTYDIYMNRYKDWLFPIDRFKREYTVRILFDRIKSPEMVLALDSVTAMFEIENSPSWYLRRSYLSGSRSTDIADSSKCTIQPEIRMSVELLKLYKIVVLGDSGVRERELTIQQHFLQSYDRASEDSHRKQVVIDYQKCVLEVLDTAFAEGYTALHEQSIAQGHGFLLVYSITNRSSFTCIPRYHKQIQRVKETSAFLPSYLNVYHNEIPPIMLVGNNFDRFTEREVSTQEGNALARELGCEFIEVSTNHAINIDKAFYDVVRQLRRGREVATHKEQRRPQRLKMFNRHGKK